MKDIQAFGVSLQGKRDYNQDKLLIKKKWDELLFCAIADGMGGHKGGEIASEIVLKASKDIINNLDRNELRADNLKDILRNIYELARIRIKEHIKNNPGLSGMGTTLVCVLIFKNIYVWGNIGDSSLYLLDKTEIVKLTKDHSVLNEAYGGANNAPMEIVRLYGHQLSRALDGTDDQEDIYPVDTDYNIFGDGEILILNSDGLKPDRTQDPPGYYSFIPLTTKDLQTAAKLLCYHALGENSDDNISVLLIEKGKRKRSVLVDEVEDAGNLSANSMTTGSNKRNEKQRNKRIIIMVSVLFVLLVSVFAMVNVFLESSVNEELNNNSSQSDGNESNVEDVLSATKTETEDAVNITWESLFAKKNNRVSYELVIMNYNGDTLKVYESKTNQINLSKEYFIEKKKNKFYLNIQQKDKQIKGYELIFYKNDQ